MGSVVRCFPRTFRGIFRRRLALPFGYWRWHTLGASPEPLSWDRRPAFPRTLRGIFRRRPALPPGLWLGVLFGASPEPFFWGSLPPYRLWPPPLACSAPSRVELSLPCVSLWSAFGFSTLPLAPSSCGRGSSLRSRPWVGLCPALWVQERLPVLGRVPVAGWLRFLLSPRHRASTHCHTRPA